MLSLYDILLCNVYDIIYIYIFLIFTISVFEMNIEDQRIYIMADIK